MLKNTFVFVYAEVSLYAAVAATAAAIFGEFNVKEVRIEMRY